MQYRRSLLLFFLFLAGAGVFVWFTSQSMPNVVASHFGTSGSANGFMPRDYYVLFILTFVVGLPLLLLVGTYVALASPRVRINLPHREYWLAPARRAETVSFLRAHSVWFAAMLVAFLCYVHWLVVRANQVQPVQLSTPGLLAGLGIFFAAMFFWAMAMIRRFSHRP
ncbi:DUF1648 domain-containing protein [Neosynechococcus sphagnicola]|uniref:DUF1648 domain-containing protein n=1 Tax=Neosynechococcus sphagnicola TaxID=1501145 RepID=UPI0006924614|nr:DUF1648 domain-containing protein [Neosynechococcus sphagnicola]